jgi:Zn-dependent protease
LVALVLHEYAHAWVATRLGDPTPRATGRLTLNPLAHLDPIGLIMLWIFRFGWAKPVQINPYFFRNQRQGMILVSLAGPVMNIIIALLGLIALRYVGYRGFWGILLQWIVLYDVLLAVFNLIPIPPLDGSKVLFGMLPARFGHIATALEGYGWVILLIAIYVGVIGAILYPLANGLLNILNGIVAMLL